MSNVSCAIALVAIFILYGLLGEMDYQDEQWFWMTAQRADQSVPAKAEPPLSMPVEQAFFVTVNQDSDSIFLTCLIHPIGAGNVLCTTTHAD